MQGIYTSYNTTTIVHSLQRTLINYSSMNNVETARRLTTKTLILYKINTKVTYIHEKNMNSIP